MTLSPLGPSRPASVGSDWKKYLQERDKRLLAEGDDPSTAYEDLVELARLCAHAQNEISPTRVAPTAARSLVSRSGRALDEPRQAIG